MKTLTRAGAATAALALGVAMLAGTAAPASAVTASECKSVQMSERRAAIGDFRAAQVYEGARYAFTYTAAEDKYKAEVAAIKAEKARLKALVKAYGNATDISAETARDTYKTYSKQAAARMKELRTELRNTKNAADGVRDASLKAARDARDLRIQNANLAYQNCWSMSEKGK